MRRRSFLKAFLAAPLAIPPRASCAISDEVHEQVARRADFYKAMREIGAYTPAQILVREDKNFTGRGSLQ